MESFWGFLWENGGWNQLVKKHQLSGQLKLKEKKIPKTDMSHEKKPSYFPLYWLVNRDPYNGLL